MRAGTVTIMRVAATLPSTAFSFVMATGIVSVSLQLHGATGLSRALFAVAALAYAVLAVLLVVQSQQRGRIATQLAEPGARFGYFTLVAASGVLATRVSLTGDAGLSPWALGLAALTLLSWFAVVAVVVRGSRADRGPLHHRVEGTWFLGTVACQSVATVTAMSADLLPAAAPVALPIALGALLAGIGWYVIVLTAVIVRFARRGIDPATLTPPYWITMGACAITVLAASRIAQTEALPQPLHGAVDTCAEFFWWFATALIPVIVVAGWWRHVRHRVPLDGTATLWAIVFPIGMYDVASTLIARHHGLAPARTIGDVGVWMALTVWGATTVVLVWRMQRRAR